MAKAAKTNVKKSAVKPASKVKAPAPSGPEISPIVDRVRREGSGVVTRHDHMIAAWGLMRAAGVLPSFAARRKPVVAIVNSFSTQAPGHAHLRALEAVIEKELKRLGFTV